MTPPCHYQLGEIAPLVISSSCLGAASRTSITLSSGILSPRGSVGIKGVGILDVPGSQEMWLDV